MSIDHNPPELPHHDQGESDRRFDLVVLVAGLVFLAMAVAFTVADMDSLETQVRVVWPTSMLAIGGGMLLGLRRR